MDGVPFRCEVEMLAFVIGVVLFFLFLGALGSVLGFVGGFLWGAWRWLRGLPS